MLLEYLKRRDKVCGICSPCGLLEQVFSDDIKLHLFIKIKLLISLTDFANLATFRASLLKTSLIVKSIQKVNSIASSDFQIN